MNVVNILQKFKNLFSSKTQQDESKSIKLTRSSINDLLNQYKRKNNIVFIHNELWNAKNVEYPCYDLSVLENEIFGFAYGAFLSKKLPLIYGVSFFQIGRLEQLRKFFAFKKAPIIIINAGAYGYDKYGWEHAFKNEEDIEIMKSLEFEIINCKEDNNIDLVKIFNELIESIQKNNRQNFKSYYIRLYKDD